MKLGGPAGSFDEALERLSRGDFSRLDSIFDDGSGAKILAWLAEGKFESHDDALAEALTCACFNGRTEVARRLLDNGVTPGSGKATGLNALHWAANRGQTEAVELLIEREAPLEDLNMYGGTALGCAVWSAINEPRGDQIGAIVALLKGGAKIEGSGYPTGDKRIDDAIRPFVR